MKILALETSTASGSVAVCDDGQILAFEQSMQSRAHSEFINPAIERCLKKSNLQLSQIDVFAAGLGPGSFTGIRVSGNIAKTFALSFQKPMVALDSLTLLYEEALLRGASSENVLCLLNAHKNMVYAAVFSKNKVELPACALTMTQLHQLSWAKTPVLCVGEGFLAYENVLRSEFKNNLLRDSRFSDFPLATTLGLAAEKRVKAHQTIDWNSFVPLYIRASEAEENQRVKSQK